MNILKIAALSAATVIVTAGTASAYTMDDGGNGFVGKGEVQTPFGWNNSDLQNKASGVTFTYEKSTSYNAVCSWTTGEGTRGEKDHDVTHKKSTAVTASVAYESRQVKGQRQITGFILNGFGATTETGTPPVVGQPCNGNSGHDGVWSSVIETSSTPGELYANHVGDGKSALLVKTVLVAEPTS